MSKKLLPPILWLCLFCLQSPQVNGQYFSHQINLADASQVHILRSKRGDRFVGQLRDIKSTTLYFQLSNGDELSFAFNEVISVITWEEEQAKGTQYWPRQFLSDGRASIAAERSIGAENLFYSSTAFNYEKGAGEVRSFAFIINIVDVGLADGISIGGGFALPDIGILRAKLTTLISSNVHFGVGTNLIFPISAISDIEGLAHTYLVFTLGNTDQYLNITAGAFLPLNSFNDNLFVASVGGAYRVASQWQLHFEALIGAAEGAFIPAIGAIWQKGNFKLEFGLAGVPAVDIESTLFPIFALGFVF